MATKYGMFERFIVLKECSDIYSIWKPKKVSDFIGEGKIEDLAHNTVKSLLLEMQEEGLINVKIGGHWTITITNNGRRHKSVLENKLRQQQKYHIQESDRIKNATEG